MFSAFEVFSVSQDYCAPGDLEPINESVPIYPNAPERHPDFTTQACRNSTGEILPSLRTLSHSSVTNHRLKWLRLSACPGSARSRGLEQSLGSTHPPNKDGTGVRNPDSPGCFLTVPSPARSSSSAFSGRQRDSPRQVSLTRSLIRTPPRLRIKLARL